MSADHSRPAHSPVPSPSSDSRTATSDVNGSRRPVRPRGPRVGMVVEQLWQPVPGGSGTYIVELAQALRARRVPVAGIAVASRRTCMTAGYRAARGHPVL